MLKGSSCRFNRGNCAQRRAFRRVCQTARSGILQGRFLNHDLRVCRLSPFGRGLASAPHSASGCGRRLPDCGWQFVSSPPTAGSGRRGHVYITEQRHGRIGKDRGGRFPLPRGFAVVAEADFDPGGEFDVHPGLAVVGRWRCSGGAPSARRRSRAPLRARGPSPGRPSAAPSAAGPSRCFGCLPLGLASVGGGRVPSSLPSSPTRTTRLAFADLGDRRRSAAPRRSVVEEPRRANQ